MYVGCRKGSRRFGEVQTGSSYDILYYLTKLLTGIFVCNIFQKSKCKFRRVENYKSL